MTSAARNWLIPWVELSKLRQWPHAGSDSSGRHWVNRSSRSDPYRARMSGLTAAMSSSLAAVSPAKSRHAHLSGRQLRRRFADHVGLPPKVLQAVLRFQRLPPNCCARGLSRLPGLSRSRPPYRTSSCRVGPATRGAACHPTGLSGLPARSDGWAAGARATAASRHRAEGTAGLSRQTPGDTAGDLGPPGRAGRNSRPAASP